jgi:sirohydrochlorin cobaltochelatase
MARWLAEAITEENVQARAEGAQLYVPIGDYFSLKGEIKNVITAVAKTTHYWREHLPPAVKQTLAAQIRVEQISRQFNRWVPPRWLGTLLLNR